MKSLAIEKNETYTSVYYQLNNTQLVLNMSNKVSNIQLSFSEKKDLENHMVSQKIPIINSFMSGDYYVIESDEHIRNYAQKIIDNSDEEELISFIKDFYFEAL
jgi:hypothetical protein